MIRDFGSMLKSANVAVNLCSKTHYGVYGIAADLWNKLQLFANFALTKISIWRVHSVWSIPMDNKGIVGSLRASSRQEVLRFRRYKMISLSEYRSFISAWNLEQIAERRNIAGVDQGDRFIFYSIFVYLFFTFLSICSSVVLAGNAVR